MTINVGTNEGAEVACKIANVEAEKYNLDLRFVPDPSQPNGMIPTGKETEYAEHILKEVFGSRTE